MNKHLILTATGLVNKTVIFTGSDGKQYSFDYISYYSKEPRIYCGYNQEFTYEQLEEIISDGNGILKELNKSVDK